MNKRENKNTKTISKSSLKKEEHRMKNIMPENINKDINKDINKRPSDFVLKVEDALGNSNTGTVVF